MSLLVIRSKEDNKKTSILLAENNIEHYCYDFVEYEYLQQLNIDVNHYDYIILTSRQISPVLDKLKFNPRQKFLVIGGFLKTYLEKLQFKNIAFFEAAEQIDKYIIEQNLNKNDILYLSAEKVSYDFKDIKRIICYKAIYKNHFSNDLIDKLQSAEINAVILLSKQQAENFLQVLEKMKLKNLLFNLKLYTMSASIAAIFNDAVKVKIAKQANLQSLINLIKTDNDKEK